MVICGIRRRAMWLQRIFLSPVAGVPLLFVRSKYFQRIPTPSAVLGYYS
jgi:hypothetical protein